MSVEAEVIKPYIGAIIHVERSTLFDPDVASRCLELLDDRQVLVFPRLGLTETEQLAFTDRLGTRVVFTQSAAGATEADIYRVTLDPKIHKRELKDGDANEQ